MKKMKLKIACLIMIAGAVYACSPANQISNGPTNAQQQRQGPGQQGPGGNGQQRPGGNGQNMPSIEQLFAHMDANKDGLLSKEEVKGPLANDFSKIDLNEDGFLSKEEIEKAPKPERR